MWSLLGKTLAILSLVGGSLQVPTNELVQRSDPIPRPSEDPWYLPPPGYENQAPGTVLKTRKAPFPIAAFALWPINIQLAVQTMYRSTNSFNNATYGVTTTLVPNNPDFSRFVSYQIAQDSPQPDCAPSYAMQLHSASGGFFGTIVSQAELLLVAACLDKGWIVNIPDHEGPKGAYLAYRLGGQQVLDSIRGSFSSMVSYGLQKTAKVVLWGYSGGAIVSAAAVELQPSYAPELKIAGAALGGLVPDIGSALQTLHTQPFLTGLVPSGMLGLVKEYTDLQPTLQGSLKESKRDIFLDTNNYCLTKNIARFVFQDTIGGYFKDPDLFTTNSQVTSVLEENKLGKHIPQVPLFVYKSILDEASKIADTDTLVNYYCAGGASVQYTRDMLSNHGALAATAAATALAWLKDRLNGLPVTPGCSKKDVITSLLDPSTLTVIPEYIFSTLSKLLLQFPMGPTFN